MKMRLFHIVFLLFCVLCPLLGKAQNAWNLLAEVKIGKKKDVSGKYEIEYPIFGQAVKQAAGKPITLKGYLIPLEELSGQDYFILSALPYSLCFFCGNAGVETVIEVQTKDKIPFTDKPITLRGTLILNETDPNHLIYRLEKAILVQ